MPGGPGFSRQLICSAAPSACPSRCERAAQRTGLPGVTRPSVVSRVLATQRHWGRSESIGHHEPAKADRAIYLRKQLTTSGFVGGGGTSRPVSRVLYQPRKARDGHPSRVTVAGGLVRSTPELGRAALRRSGRRAGALPFNLAPGGVCRAVRVTPDAGALLPHRFTLTGEPPEGCFPAVCFLWHFPAGHPGSVLPITLPCGARTFLDPTARRRGAPRPSGRLVPS